MKYKIIFLLFTIISLASCDPIFFDRRPGQLLSSIPDKFVGEYDVYDHKLKNGKDTVEHNDSIYTISKTWVNFHDRGTPLLNLNDTFTVSEYKGYYFISLRRAPGYWMCSILQETNNGFIGCALLLNSESLHATKDKDAINELKKYFPHAHLIRIKDSDGSEEFFYTKMNEDQVIAYFKDEIKKPEYLEFVKR